MVRTTRRRTSAAVIALLGTLPGSAAERHGADRREISAAIGRGCRLLVEPASPAGEPIRDAIWSVRCPGTPPRALGPNLSALVAVDRLAASPEGDLLAVLSHGEGHPWLEIVDLSRLRTEGRYVVLHELNPYPGMIGIQRWLADALLVRSDMPLDELDGGQPLGAERIFRPRR